MRIKQCFHYLQQLKRFLLPIKVFTDADLAQFDSIVKEFQANWVKLTKRKPFPKLHLLTHAVEFARNHRYLGRYSESAIESHHGFVREVAGKHANTADKPGVRL